MSSLTFSKPIVIFIGIMIFLALWLLALTIYVWRVQAVKKRVGTRIKDENDIVDVIGNIVDKVENLAGEHSSTTRAGQESRAMIHDSVRRVGVIRFNAFPEVGGRLSFAAALLSDKGDGVVISSINGRNESRVYAKPISNRDSDYPLSEEEEAAIESALKGACDEQA